MTSFGVGVVIVVIGVSSCTFRGIYNCKGFAFADNTVCPKRRERASKRGVKRIDWKDVVGRGKKDYLHP